MSQSTPTLLVPIDSCGLVDDAARADTGPIPHPYVAPSEELRAARLRAAASASRGIGPA